MKPFHAIVAVAVLALAGCGSGPPASTAGSGGGGIAGSGGSGGEAGQGGSGGTGGTPAVCGDGNLDAGEDCDDGALDSDTRADACRTDCKKARCGDSVVDSGEECDDANTSNTDGCVACKKAKCGDGFVEDGHEACDDGASNSDTQADACRSNCTAHHCGDLVVDTGEGCDDGNLDEGDACLSSCVAASCGDGVIERGVEACDDGTKNSDTDPDACRTDCKKARCGDGVRDKFEQCDDGNTVDNDACSNNCVKGRCGDGKLQVGEDCDDGNGDSTDTCVQCKPAFCGDGFVEKGMEECDQGMNNSDTTPDACRTSCQKPRCGDGVTDKGEDCDDANMSNLDACTNLCKAPYCGDGIVEKDEECDDGAKNSDKLANACRTTCLKPTCGDGVVDKGESCDDSNLVDGDGCTKSCVLELPALGNALVYKGSLDATDPTWQRPAQGNHGDGAAWDTSCAVETVDAKGGFYYESFEVVNTEAVDRKVRIEAAWAPPVDMQTAADGYLVAYSSFDAADPQTSCLGADDDWAYDGHNRRSHLRGISVPAGTSIFVVASAFASKTSFGAFEIEVTNDGCGDSSVDGAETCDDGNLGNNDGCDAICGATRFYGAPRVQGKDMQGMGLDDDDQKP